MKCVIYHSTSKKRNSEKIAREIEGDHFEIKQARKPYKCSLCKFVAYGYQTMSGKDVGIKEVHVNLDKYDEIYLVSPVWAGRINAYMRQFIRDYPIKNKKIHIIGHCEGSYDNYFETFQKELDPSNEIVEKSIYVKGVKQ